MLETEKKCMLKKNASHDRRLESSIPKSISPGCDSSSSILLSPAKAKDKFPPLWNRGCCYDFAV